MIWLSPAYPVGGYSYSHGLEWVVETGKVRRRRDARRVDRGRAGARRRTLRRDLAGRGLACAGCRRHGARSSTRPSWRRRSRPPPSGAWRRWRRAPRSSPPRWRPGRSRSWRALAADGREVAYPVAVGAAAAAHGLPLVETAQAFAQAFAANLVSAGVRLIPLGQSDGLRVLAALEPLIPRMVAARARRRASTTSAARRSPPTSPPCGTRRSIRGCSDREAETP